MHTPTVGTIIHGTLLPEHLIPAFLPYAPDSAELAGEWEDLAAVPEADRGHRWYEHVGVLMDDLFDALEQVARDHGMWFGSHPGDGADFGFWKDDQ